MSVSTNPPTDLAALCARLDTLIELLTRRATDAQIPTSPYVTIAELAKLIGVGLRTVKTWRASGNLPKPIRVGRTVRWLRTDIDEFLKRKRK
jgi:excisionase family DNA binding protein